MQPGARPALSYVSPPQGYVRAEKPVQRVKEARHVPGAVSGTCAGCGAARRSLVLRRASSHPPPAPPPSAYRGHAPAGARARARPPRSHSAPVRGARQPGRARDRLDAGGLQLSVDGKLDREVDRIAGAGHSRGPALRPTRRQGRGRQRRISPKTASSSGRCDASGSAIPTCS